MTTRKGISKKIRFEILKRDSFTCQYCGKTAPDVILEIDHITPIKNNGTNDIMNLITSCKDCNRGKGARKLNDNEIIKKQQEQLKEINEKREQLELMLEWKEELSKFEDEQVNKIEKLLEESTTHVFSKSGREDCKNNIKKYGFEEVYECTKISISQYLREDDEESIMTVFNMISRICKTRVEQQKDSWAYKRKYIYATLRNRVGIYNEGRVVKALREIVNSAEDYQIVYEIACYCTNWSNFWQEINDYYEGNY